MKVSIIISNRNDVSMLVVTLRSCIEELRPLGLKNCEIVVCDNSDIETYKLLGSAVPIGYVRDRLIKVFRQDFPCLFSARETAIKHASGDYILCVDSHCIIGRDMILDLVNFMDSKQSDPTLGFAHAPINWAHQHERASKHDRDMSVNELGDWGGLRSTPQTITWKGMPWICRREWFLNKETGIGGYGSLAEHKVSWGGGDMFIGLKPWLLGFKNWAVP
ncbi:glycosyltransferase family 2 protein, partial [bacterium]|nr:glycosyltransferase family 2 protein [bacterium]